MNKAQLVAVSAEFYGKELNREQVLMYLKVLKDLSRDELQEGLYECMRDPNIKAFPLPAIVLEKVRPRVDADSEAREVASRILKAVSKFGWCNPNEAREFIGEFGWRIVDRWGGWICLNEKLGVEINETTFQAQARDLAKSMFTRSKAGVIEKPPVLPESPIKNLTTQITKELPNGGDKNAERN